MLSTDDVYVLINYTSFIESLFTTVSVAGLLWLRYKQPERERPIRVRKLPRQHAFNHTGGSL